jgi:hypothetical protein
VDGDWRPSRRVWALEPADVPVVIERCGVVRDDILAFAYKVLCAKLVFDRRVGGVGRGNGGWGMGGDI